MEHVPPERSGSPEQVSAYMREAVEAGILSQMQAEALDPEATYTVAGQDYHLLHSGDGFAMFEGAKGVILTGKLDSEVLIDYIKDSLGGEVGSDYADPYGQGRIKIIQ